MNIKKIGLLICVFFPTTLLIGCESNRSEEAINPSRAKVTESELDPLDCSGEKYSGYRDKNGKRQGPWIFFNDLGQPEKRTHYKSGIENGVFKTYHKNGKIAEDGFKENGELYGTLKLWNEDGSSGGYREYNEMKMMR